MSETFEEWFREKLHCGYDPNDCSDATISMAWSHQQQKIDKLERDNEVLKMHLNELLAWSEVNEDVPHVWTNADKALSKIRSEGNE